MRRALPALLLSIVVACGGGGGDESDDGALGEDALSSAMPHADGADKKVYPTNKDRDLACPTIATSVDHYAPAQASLAAVDVERDALRDVVPSNVRVALVLVKRTAEGPRYRYLSNGTQDVVYQPWSSTKWIATANAASKLREASNGAVGLTASVSGIPLGDLVTGITTYTAKVSSSNGLARYMHDIGGRARAHDLATQWLGRTNESLGGNYGEPSANLPMTFKEAGGASVTIARDTSSGYENQLSALTEVEILKRLVMHREDEATRMAHVEWEDLSTLFYGAETSSWYPGKWGGMSADKAIYLQSALDMRTVEEDAKGQWRIYSKIGYGTPSDPQRGTGEIVEVEYACLPKVDDAGRAVADAGHEFFLAIMTGSGGRSMGERDQLFADYHAKIVGKILAGDFD
jgi:hypothetical protein